MTDIIYVRGLLLRTIIGVNAEERLNRQDVIIDLALHVDTHAAGASDNLEDSVNYRTLTKRVIQLVENSQFYLIERLAAEIARECLTDSRVERVEVTVEKPAALRFARSVGVRIERSRSDFS